MLRLIRYKNDVQSDLIKGIEWEILEAFTVAIKNKHEDVATKLADFAIQQVALSKNHNKLDIFGQYIFFPFYSYAIVKKTDFHSDYIHKYAVFFKSLIAFGLKYSHEKESDKIDYKPYIYKAYFGYIAFLHSVLEIANQEQVDTVFNEFDYLRDNENTYYGLRYELLDLVSKEDSKAFQDALEKSDEMDYIQNIHRRVRIALKSWIVFLFSIGKMDTETFMWKEKHLKINYHYFETMINDVNILTESEYSGFLGLSEWDFMVRNSGMYSPPTPRHWIILGVVFDLLRGESPHVIPGIIKENKNNYLLYDEFKSKINQIKSDPQKWLSVLKIDSEEVLKEKSKAILEPLLQLKRQHYTSIEKSISSQPLDETLVNEFKKNLAIIWEKSSRVFHLFIKEGNYKNASDTSTLPEILFLRFLERFKQMFVKDHNQQIYGTDQLASICAHYYSFYFLNQIVQSKPLFTESEQYAEIFDACIQELQKNATPSFIFVPYEFLHNDIIEQNKDYVPKWDLWKNGENITYDGKYKNIPIIATDSLNHVIVCDFKNAFELEIGTKGNYVNNYVSIEVNELEKPEIEDKFNMEKEKWSETEYGIKLNNEEIKTRIATTVKLIVKVQGKINILSSDSFVIGRFKAGN